MYIAPFVQSPPDVVDCMLTLAGIRPADVLYDLGSGDGRIVIAAAERYGIRAVGFEVDPDLVRESRARIDRAGLADLAEIREESVTTANLSAASVVTMYLWPGANIRLRGMLRRRLPPGARVISHEFGMGTWTPQRVERMIDADAVPRTIYLWRIPDR